MRAETRPAFAMVLAAVTIALPGCWPWHRHQASPQQKFMEALDHGNAAQASQLWLNMDAESRANFAHSQGMQPMMSPDEIKKQVIRHYAGEMGSDETGEPGVSIDQVTPRLGGLESLPEYVGPSGAPPQTVNVPPKTETEPRTWPSN